MPFGYCTLHTDVLVVIDAFGAMPFGYCTLHTEALVGCNN
jgi:hypothetical protein